MRENNAKSQDIGLIAKRPIFFALISIGAIIGLGVLISPFALKNSKAKHINEANQRINAPRQIGMEGKVQTQSDGLVLDFDVNKWLKDSFIFDVKNLGQSKDWLLENDKSVFSPKSLIQFNIENEFDENIAIAPFLVIKIIEVTPINNNIAGFHKDRFTQIETDDDYFNGALLPKTGIQFAPILDNNNNIQAINLAHNDEKDEHLLLNFTSGYFYKYQIGMIYKQGGIDSIKYFDNIFQSGMPDKQIAIASEEGGNFTNQQHPMLQKNDLQKFEQSAELNKQKALANNLFDLKKLGLKE
jgi:hypothetical protein